MSQPRAASCSRSGGGTSGQARHDADPVVGGVPRVAESPVAVDQDHVGVARPFQVLPRERERCGIDVDGHDKTLGAHHLPRQRRAVAGPHPNLQEGVPLPQAVQVGVAYFLFLDTDMVNDAEREMPILQRAKAEMPSVRLSVRVSRHLAGWRDGSAGDGKATPRRPLR
jgi:hypothetical protein